MLVDLIAQDTLDIRIAVKDTAGIYHDKLGILKDFEGNVVIFYGSANSSLSGYQTKLIRSLGSPDNSVPSEA